MKRLLTSFFIALAALLTLLFILPKDQLEQIQLATGYKVAQEEHHVPYPLNLHLQVDISHLKLAPVSMANFSLTAHLHTSHEGFQGSCKLLCSDLELLLPTASTTLTADASIDLAFTGTKINGSLDITKGTFEVLPIKTKVTNLKGHAELNDSIITVTELSAEGDSGQLTGTGIVTLSSERKFPFLLDLHLENIAFSPLNYATATADGDIKFKGNSEEALLEGTVEARTLDIIIPDKMPASICTVDVTYINASTPTPKPYYAQESTWPLAFDLDLIVPRKGIVKGKEWSSEWKGSAKMTGTADNILLQGACHIVKGEYRLNGQLFDIREGTITFAGEPAKKTSIYIIASKDLNAIRADLILKGPIGHPALSFQSNPPLPQREIVSWILFNRGASDITDFQGTQLNESITDLGMAGSKPDLLTQIRNQIGIDRLDINRKENGTSNEVSLQVGKYLTHGIFVSINKSITAEANSLAVEADLLKNVKMQAEVSDNAEGLLLLKWKRDY